MELGYTWTILEIAWNSAGPMGRMILKSVQIYLDNRERYITTQSMHRHAAAYFTTMKELG